VPNAPASPPLPGFEGSVTVQQR